MNKNNEKIGFDHKLAPNKSDVISQFKHLFKFNKKESKKVPDYSYNFQNDDKHLLTD